MLIKGEKGSVPVEVRSSKMLVYVKSSLYECAVVRRDHGNAPINLKSMFPERSSEFAASYVGGARLKDSRRSGMF